MDYSLSDHNALQPNISSQIRRLHPLQFSCSAHNQQPLSNYCKDAHCYQLLCAECIQPHLAHHKKQSLPETFLPSIRTVRHDCIDKLTRIIDELTLRMRTLQQPKDPQTLLQDIHLKLQTIKNALFQTLGREFARLAESAKAKISESYSSLKQLEEIHYNLDAIVAQLKEQCTAIYEGRENIPQALINALKIEEKSLYEMYEKQGQIYMSKLKKLGLDVTCNIQGIRLSVVDNIKLATYDIPQQKQLSSRSRSKSVKKSKQHFQLNYESNSKILHFFEAGAASLHLLQLQNNQLRSKQIKLRQFIVPLFHASLLSQHNDCIYISGGILNLSGVQTKTPLFSKFSLKNQSLKRDFARVKQRSTHTLVQSPNGECVYVLGGYRQSTFSEDGPSIECSFERVNSKSGRVEEEAASKWGGANIAFALKYYVVKACEEGVEAYNLAYRQWAKVDVKSQMVFYTYPGSCAVGDNAWLVFGGYDASLCPVDLCSLWKFSEEKSKGVYLEIGGIKTKLSAAEGFGNGVGVSDGRSVYALQNIADQNKNQNCIENVRRVIRLDCYEGACECVTVAITSEL